MSPYPCTSLFFFLMLRRPPRSTLSSSSAASDVYKRQEQASMAERLRGSEAVCARLKQDKADATARMQEAELAAAKAAAAIKLSEAAAAAATQRQTAAEEQHRQAVEETKTAVFEKDEAVCGREAAEAARDDAQHSAAQQVREAKGEAQAAREEARACAQRNALLEQQHAQLQAEHSSALKQLAAAEDRAAVLAAEKSLLQTQLGEQGSQLKALHSTLEAAQAARDAAQAAVAALEHSSSQAAQGEQALAHKLGAAEVAVAALQDQLARLKAMNLNTASAARQAAEDLATAQVELAQQAKELARLNSELATALDTISKLELGQHGAAAEEAASARAMAAMEGRLEEALGAVKEALGRVAGLTAERDEAVAGQEELKDQAAEMRVCCMQHTTDLQGALDQLPALEQRCEQAQEQHRHSTQQRDQAMSEARAAQAALDAAQAALAEQLAELDQLRSLRLDAFNMKLKRLVRAKVLGYRLAKLNALARSIAPAIPEGEAQHGCIAATERCFADSLGLLNMHFTSQFRAKLDRADTITLRFADVIAAMASAHAAHASELEAGVTLEALEGLASTVLHWHPQAIVFAQIVQRDTTQSGHPKHCRCVAGPAGWIYQAETQHTQGLGMFAHVIMTALRVRCYAALAPWLGEPGAALQDIDTKVGVLCDGLQGMVRMQSLLEQSNRDFVQMGRQVLKEGMVHVASKMCSPAIKYVFLLSDMLLVTHATSRGSFILEAVLELTEHEYKLERCPELDCYMTLQGPDVKDEDGQLLQHGRWVFKTTNPVDGTAWFEQTKTAGPTAQTVLASALLDVEGRGLGGVEMQKMEAVKQGIGAKVKAACQPKQRQRSPAKPAAVGGASPSKPAPKRR
eukprot:TRINITY_DN7308_c0_g1_i3.p1 TRINITY_DN7308_c0_g1~~TRINITY_DN7308_c0_g1_i3.p1  ORF type:complete len:861 (-),score=361.65 TRINITY_DN7308_c0_g1_i3:178-2760(-)